jgi:hypothetical protein
VYLGVNQRFAPRDRNHRRPGLLDRRQRLVDRHPLLEDVLGVLDLAAERTGQVALKQGLQLDQQRVLLAPVQLLREQVLRHLGRLSERGSHV